MNQDRAAQPKDASRRASKSAARSPKPRAAQAPQLSPLEAKQAKKSVSDAAYAAASATRKATDRLNELAETIERCVADGLSPIVIEAELLAAASRADVELPLDDLRALLRK
ncbi:hypothetical protein [Nocardia sp. CA-120079]|uniref:hypothetical protein n=1 Tax=Nocardia sp. CA-120079 TaxID=3239974 RepID=UPI003D998D60